MRNSIAARKLYELGWPEEAGLDPDGLRVIKIILTGLYSVRNFLCLQDYRYTIYEGNKV